MEKLNRSVCCIETYVEDAEEYWSKGCCYKAAKISEDEWLIETNFGSIGIVGPDYMADDFEELFVEL